MNDRDWMMATPIERQMLHLLGSISVALWMLLALHLGILLAVLITIAIKG